MRTLAVVALGFLMAGGLSAQHRPVGPVGGFGNVVFPGSGGPPVHPGVSGFGNILTPGTPRPQLGFPHTIVPPFSITDPTFAKGLQRTVSGRGLPFQDQRRSPFVHRGQQFVHVPFPYPVYAGDPYGVQQPQVTVVYPPPTPPVVIQQSFGGPAQQMFPEEGEDNGIGDISVYQAPTRSAEEMAAAVPAAPYYLIAFKDHSIYSAVAYWIDGETLHYFTSGNNHNQVSMALVDRELTERLNRERKVDVRLPK